MIHVTCRVPHPFASFCEGMGLAIRPSAISHSPNLNCVGIRTNKEHAVIANAQPDFISTLQSLNITHTGLCETMQRREDVHCVWFASGANIALGRIGPDDPLHFGS
jgi:hypothetical protein